MADRTDANNIAANFLRSAWLNGRYHEDGSEWNLWVEAERLVNALLGEED